MAQTYSLRPPSVDDLFSHLSGLYGFQQLLLILDWQRHLEIHASFDGFLPVMDAEYEIRHGETFKSPIVAQNVGKQLAALTTVVTHQTVVSAHDRSSSGLNDFLEVWQVDLVQDTITGFDVDEESVVLDVVRRVVL